jgi:hypothetical protein
METEGMRTQLTALAKQLDTVVNIIAPHFNGSTATTRTIEERRAFFDKVRYSIRILSYKRMLVRTEHVVVAQFQCVYFQPGLCVNTAIDSQH